MSWFARLFRRDCPPTVSIFGRRDWASGTVREDSLSRAAAFVSAFQFKDADSVEALLEDAPGDLACGLAINVLCQLERLAELEGRSFEEELQEFALSSAMAERMTAEGLRRQWDEDDEDEDEEP